MADDMEDHEGASFIARRNALLASKLAAEHIPACIAELVSLTKISGRPGVRRRAAADLIRIATQLPVRGELDEKLTENRE
jgi:hypothetical protein